MTHLMRYGSVMTTVPGQELLDLCAAAHRLRSAIRESGLTTSEVARRAGVSRSRLDAYLKAESQPSRS